ncbi:TraB/GumN family protein [Flavobacterium sp. H122]|uniref:TraB/GumN family protein n=1 Tax=Flavobacterium sp. H122 TaxID=2529860 RepID=UPI0010AAFC4C|nr:TraB/GumN family protein [Flavobacterium sp. H122]
MKNLLKSAIAATVSIFGFSANAQMQSVENEKSLLWEVSGNGLEKPSYLYGTVHMICEKDYILKPKVTEAFAKTTKLALEINMSDPNEMSNMQKAAMGTELLSKKLSPAQLAELETILQKQAGISVKQVDNYSMLTIMSLLSIKSFGCQNLKFYEMELVSKAKETNKPVMGLETVNDQMNYLGKSFPDNQMLKYLKTISETETQKLVQNYIKEDAMAIYKEVVNPESMDANGKKWLLDIRNANWVKQMPELMKKESVFFAVGVAHLGGELGVIQLLKKAGYTVKPIMN